MSATTILYDGHPAASVDAVRDGEHLWLKPADLAQSTGWKLATEGLCKGDLCVRTDPRWIGEDGAVDLTAFARHMGQPIVRDDAHNAVAFGASVSTRRDALFSLQAPDFTLPDLDGNLHSLSDYRGKKVFLFSWGSY